MMKFHENTFSLFGNKNEYNSLRLSDSDSFKKV